MLHICRIFYQFRLYQKKRWKKLTPEKVENPVFIKLVSNQTQLLFFTDLCETGVTDVITVNKQNPISAIWTLFYLFLFFLNLPDIFSELKSGEKKVFILPRDSNSFLIFKIKSRFGNESFKIIWTNFHTKCLKSFALITMILSHSSFRL